MTTPARTGLSGLCLLRPCLAAAWATRCTRFSWAPDCAVAAVASKDSGCALLDDGAPAGYPN